MKPVVYLAVGAIGGVPVAKVGVTSVLVRYRMACMQMKSQMPGAVFVTSTDAVDEWVMLTHFRRRFRLLRGREWFIASPEDAARRFATVDGDRIVREMVEMYRTGASPRQLAAMFSLGRIRVCEVCMARTNEPEVRRIRDCLDAGLHPIGVQSLTGIPAHRAESVRRQLRAGAVA